MSSTRHQSPSADPDTAPERHTSDPSIAGINIGLNVIGRVARNRTDPQRRAMVWIHNYALHTRLTADMLSEDLDLSRAEIRAALSDPLFPHMTKFVEKTAALRARFEAQLPRICTNRVSETVRLAMLEAYEDSVFSLCVGPERVGKTTPFFDLFLRQYMDCGIFFTSPESRDMRSYIAAWATALGITTTRAKKNDLMRDQVCKTMETGIIRLVCMDEAQRNFPTDLAGAFPEKIEFQRTVWDTAEISRRARLGRDKGGGIGIVNMVTPQFEHDLCTALDTNRRWKPGQFEGRMRRSHTPDTLTETEVRAIARHHAADFDPASIDTLVAVTLASPGLLGFLGNVIGKIRFMVRHQNKEVSPALVAEAARIMLRGTTTERKAKERAAKAKQA